MAPLSDLLRRFRRLGTPPGPPAAGLGVPARAGEALTAELLPVFTLVDAITDDAHALVEGAGPEARRMLAEGREQAERIRADGARRADEARAAVAASRESAIRSELARIEADADAEIARIGQVARTRHHALAELVVDRVRGTA